MALTEGNLIFSWGVNDEGALGRETGMHLLLLLLIATADADASLRAPIHALAQAASAQCDSLCSLFARPRALRPSCAGGELWEKSGHATGKPGDAYVPGKVQMPQEAGKVVQLSTGREGLPS